AAERSARCHLGDIRGGLWWRGSSHGRRPCRDGGCDAAGRARGARPPPPDRTRAQRAVAGAGGTAQCACSAAAGVGPVDLTELSQRLGWARAHTKRPRSPPSHGTAHLLPTLPAGILTPPRASSAGSWTRSCIGTPAACLD